MAAVRGEGHDLPVRCISLLQEVKDLIEARSSGPENTDKTAAFSSSERQARSKKNITLFMGLLWQQHKKLMKLKLPIQ